MTADVLKLGTVKFVFEAVRFPLIGVLVFIIAVLVIGMASGIETLVFLKGSVVVLDLALDDVFLALDTTSALMKGIL